MRFFIKLLDIKLNFFAFFRLCMFKFLDALDITTTEVAKPQKLHINHITAMSSQMVLKVRLKHKQLFFKSVLCFHAVVELYSFFPHTHELPLLELFEEVEFLNMVVGIALNQPLTKRDKFTRHLIFVQGQTFARKCVVSLFFPHVRNHF